MHWKNDHFCRKARKPMVEIRFSVMDRVCVRAFNRSMFLRVKSSKLKYWELARKVIGNRKNSRDWILNDLLMIYCKVNEVRSVWNTIWGCAWFRKFPPKWGFARRIGPKRTFLGFWLPAATSHQLSTEVFTGMRQNRTNINLKRNWGLLERTSDCSPTKHFIEILARTIHRQRPPFFIPVLGSTQIQLISSHYGFPRA